MTVDLEARTSRRALLIGLAGGVAGAVAATMAGAQRVFAGVDDGNPLIVGQLRDTLQTTTLRNESTNQAYPPAFRVRNATNTAIEGIAGSGFGLHAEAQGSGWSSIAALKENPGSAISAAIVDPGSGSASIDASTEGTGPGIYGQSARGRGGRFRGPKAQIRLDPASASTHPASGSAGDLFVDKAKRLWFCRGGSNWVRLA